MGCLSTDSFCFCLSLRSGGIFVGFLGLVGSIMGALWLYQNETIGFTIAPLFLAFLFIFWLEGIQYERPSWMFPIVIFWILTLWVAVAGYAFVFYLFYVLKTPQKKFKCAITDEVMMIALIAIAYLWYFAAVSCSLFRKIKEERYQPTVISIVNQQMRPSRVPTCPPYNDLIYA